MRHQGFVSGFLPCIVSDMNAAQDELMRQGVKLSFGEEVGNTVSHGVMFLLLLFALPYYSIQFFLKYGPLGAWGMAIYIISMIFMFGTSSLYHMMAYGTTYKYVFRKMDHIMIVVAIAGTYTPICLVLLNNWVGWTILAIEWSMAISAIILKAVAKKRYKKLSLTIYLVMGWMAVFIFPELIHDSNWIFIILLLAGGLCYTVGILFYNRPGQHYNHFIWHIFIIVAALCHFIAIAYFL